MGTYEGKFSAKLKNPHVEENGKGVQGYNLLGRMLA